MTRFLLLFLACLAWGKDIPWDLKALYRKPEVFAAQSEEAGVKAMYYASVPWKGKATRVFAYYGAPSGKNLPAMLLIHGGGGTAFAEWVRLWNRRGYAALAMDTGGLQPETATPNALWNPKKAHHEAGGPEGWGGFSAVSEPLEEQWPYHAVAAAILGHSLLRSMPEVDPRRVGVTGISWGGYLTSIVASLDDRFRFAAPIYGCGFLGEDSTWLKNFAEMGPEKAQRWLGAWDPSVYLPRAQRPMLWMNGTNDFAYPMNSWQKSYRLPKGKRTLSVPVRMKHSHPDGAIPEEIHAFANAMLRGGAPLVKIRATTSTETRYEAAVEVVKAELNFTRDTGKWQERRWETVPAELDGKAKRASYTIPAGARVWYVNLVDARGLIVSTEHVEIP
jgi:dienelactone hydrolase